MTTQWFLKSALLSITALSINSFIAAAATGTAVHWAVAELTSTEASKVDQTFYFPAKLTTADCTECETCTDCEDESCTACCPQTPNDDKTTSCPTGQATLSYKVKILTKPSGNQLGTVALIGAYYPHPADNQSTALIPEFVWVKVKDKNPVQYVAYKVTVIEADFFKNFVNCKGTQVSDLNYSTVYLPPSVPEFKCAIPGLSSTTLYIAPTWQTVDYDNKKTKISEKYTGSAWFAPNMYTEGAEQVAKMLQFGSPSSDQRTLTVNEDALKKIATFLAKGESTANTGLTLQLGAKNSDDRKGEPDITLAPNALAAPGLAAHFTSLTIAENIQGDLGQAGFAKYRAAAGKETKLTVDLSAANSKLFSVTGDSLFAGIAELKLTLPTTNTKLITAIGDSWFAGTTISSVSGNIDAVTSIGDNAFKGAKMPSSSSLNLSKVTTLGDSAFFNTDFGSTTVAFGAASNGIFGSSPAITSIGTGAFANDKTDNTTKFDGIETLTAVTSLGSKVFSGVKLEVTAESGVLELPFKNLVSVGSDVFGSATFFDDKSTSLTIEAVKVETEKAPKNVAEDAFGKFKVEVPAAVYEAWKEVIPTVEFVAGTDVSEDAKKSYILILDKNGKEKNYNETKKAYVLNFGFKEARTLSFYDGFESGGARFFSITGPSVPGFTTAKDSLAEIQDLDEQCIDLNAFAFTSGLYIIKLYQYKTGDALATKLLQIAPTELSSALTADTLTIPYNGGASALLTALKAITLDSITFRDADGKPYDASGLNLKIDSVKASDLTNVRLGTHPALLKVKATGNATGTIEVPVNYIKLDLTKANIHIDPVPFSLQAKDFKPKTVKINGFTAPVNKKAELPDDSTYVTIDYGTSSTTGIGSVDVTLTGHGSLSGTVATFYLITADWTSKAVINTEEDYFLGQTLIYNGAPRTHFNTFVSPLLLSEEEYEVVAIAATDEALNSLAGKDTFTQIADTGSFDFYLIPTDKKYYGNAAAYVGNLEIKPLPLDSLRAAAIVSKTGDDDFALSFDQKIFAGSFQAELEDEVFTVTLSKEQVASISGLEKLTFEIKIPTDEPKELEVKYPFAYGAEKEKRLYILVGETFDLSTIIFADADAKVDFKDGLVFKSSKQTKLFVEGSILTALDEWNGTITVSYLNEDFDKTATIEILVSAVYDEDLPPITGNEVIADASKAISYANGALTVKGFAGATVAVYSLNGATVATAPVLSNDAVVSLELSKGFYLIKAGSSVTKIVVH